MRIIPRVYMDACCFIDLAKQRIDLQTPKERDAHIFYCKKFIEAARNDDASVYTSTVSVVECVKVTDHMTPGGPTIEDERVKALFKGMLMSAKSGILPVMPNPRITEDARNLRWEHGITCGPMDAIHIATALSVKCSHFFTTDGKLGVENINKISSLGLTICTADRLADVLPDEYRQLPLRVVHDAEQGEAGSARAKWKG